MTVLTNDSFPPFLEREIEFNDGSTYTLLAPVTELRSCHDGVPAESRIIFTCRQTQPIAKTEEAIMKVKVQYGPHNPTPQLLTASPTGSPAATADPATTHTRAPARQRRKSSKSSASSPRPRPPPCHTFWATKSCSNPPRALCRAAISRTPP